MSKGGEEIRYEKQKVDNSVGAIFTNWTGNAANAFENKYYDCKSNIEKLIDKLNEIEKCKQKLTDNIIRAKEEYAKEQARNK